MAEEMGSELLSPLAVLPPDPGLAPEWGGGCTECTGLELLDGSVLEPPVVFPPFTFFFILKIDIFKRFSKRMKQVVISYSFISNFRK